MEAAPETHEGQFDYRKYSAEVLCSYSGKVYDSGMAGNRGRGQDDTKVGLSV